MKIALFCPAVSGRGGMETAIRNLISGFQALGDECRLVLLGGTFDQRWLDGVPFTQIADPASPRWLRMLSYALGPSLFLRRWTPDVIIAADMTSLRMALFARRLTGNRRIPIGSWVHFPVSMLRMKEFLARAEFHLAISDDIAEDIRLALPPEGSPPVQTIYNGVPVGVNPVVRRPEEMTFLYVGRISWEDQKRVKDIVAALGRLKGKFRAKFVGAAPPERAGDEERLKQLAEDLGISDRIEWLGWQADPWSNLEATALIMSSAHEGFPMVLVEAISRGLPCISSNCKSGPSEVIEENRNGWLYPVGDVDRLAGILQRVLDRPDLLPAPETVVQTAHRFSDRATAGRAKQGIQQAMLAQQTTG